MGGAFSTLAETLQLPLSHLLIAEVDPEFVMALQESLDGSYIGINTGISALGRSTKVQNLLQALQEGGAAVEIATQADRRIDPTKIMDIVFQGRSVNTDEIFKSPEQLAEEIEAEQQQQEAMGEMQEAQAQANLMADESQVGQI